MGQNAHLKAQRASIDPRAPDFLSSHPATPERVSNAIANARQFTGAGLRRARQGRISRRCSTAWSTARTRARASCAGGKFLHPKLGFTFTAPEGFTLDNTAQAVFGVKDNGAQALRLDVVRVPAEQTLPEYLNSGWIENIDLKSIEEMTVGGFPAATATANGDQWTFRLYVVRFGSEVYRVIYAAKNRTEAVDKSFRESLSHVPPHDRCRRSQSAQPLQAQGRAGQARRHRREVRAPHGGGRPRGRAVPRAQRPRRQGPRQGRRYGQGGGGVTARHRRPMPATPAGRLVVMGVRMTRPPSYRFGRDKDDMAVTNAALRDHLVGKGLHLGAVSFEDGHLQAAFSVQMHMQRRLRQIMMIVEALGEALRQFAGMMVVDIDQRRDAMARARHLDGCLLQAGPG